MLSNWAQRLLGEYPSLPSTLQSQLESQPQESQSQVTDINIEAETPTEVTPTEPCFLQLALLEREEKHLEKLAQLIEAPERSQRLTSAEAAYNDAEQRIARLSQQKFRSDGVIPRKKLRMLTPAPLIPDTLLACKETKEPPVLKVALGELRNEVNRNFLELVWKKFPKFRTHHNLLLTETPTLTLQERGAMLVLIHREQEKKKMKVYGVRVFNKTSKKHADGLQPFVSVIKTLV